ncbi:antitoxin VbhA family protein [Corynebacterium sp. S7]
MWADQAKHSLSLEGLRASKEFNSDTDSYIAGEISADQLVEKTRARFGLL